MPTRKSSLILQPKRQADSYQSRSRRCFSTQAWESGIAEPLVEERAPVMDRLLKELVAGTLYFFSSPHTVQPPSRLYRLPSLSFRLAMLYPPTNNQVFCLPPLPVSALRRDRYSNMLSSYARIRAASYEIYLPGFDTMSRKTELYIIFPDIQIDRDRRSLWQNPLTLKCHENHNSTRLHLSRRRLP